MKSSMVITERVCVIYGDFVLHKKKKKEKKGGKKEQQTNSKQPVDLHQEAALGGDKRLASSSEKPGNFLGFTSLCQLPSPTFIELA